MAARMGTSRLEGFSDGVIAIVITIMVLELEAPEGTGWADLAALGHVALSYVLSFVYLGMHWANHHHLMRAAPGVDAHGAPGQPRLPLLAVADPIRDRLDGAQRLRPGADGAPRRIAARGRGRAPSLEWRVEALTRPGSPLRRAMGIDRKGCMSVAAYAVGIALAFAAPWAAAAIYAVIAVAWIVPDRRVERAIAEDEGARSRADDG